MIINGIDFEIVVNVKKIKKIYFRIKNINNKNYLIISSYRKLSMKEVQNILRFNNDSVNRLIEKMPKNPLKEDQILILGNIYNKNNCEDKIKDAFNEITKLFNYYKKIFNKENTLLKFRKMKTRWGVCHITKNYINLSLYLIHIPICLIEYVIIHEFCHFLYPNHSKQFYSEVLKYCPDYKKRIKELKCFSYVLVF